MTKYSFLNDRVRTDMKRLFVVNKIGHKSCTGRETHRSDRQWSRTSSIGNGRYSSFAAACTSCRTCCILGGPARQDLASIAEIASKMRSLANWNGYRHDIYRMGIITRNEFKHTRRKLDVGQFPSHYLLRMIYRRLLHN